MRIGDLDALHLEKLLADAEAGVTTSSPPPDILPKIEGEGEGAGEAEVKALEEEAEADNPRKRKRKEKKEAKRIAAIERVSEQGNKPFDETLLAIIGVLDEIKLQRNVAAWVRAGGLWGPDGRPRDTGTNTSASTGSEDERTTSDSVLPSSSTAVSPSHASETTNGSTVVDHDANAGENKNTDDRSARRKEKKRRRRRAQARVQAQGQVDGTNERGGSPPTGNDAVSSVDPEKAAERDSATPEAPASSPVMWFEHPETLQFWVARGKKALEKLRIPILHGVER